MSESVIVTLPEAEPWLTGLQGVNGATWEIWDVCSAPSEQASGARLVVLPYLGRPTALDQLSSMPNLVAVQTLTAGYDGLPEQIPTGVQLCNAAGVHDASTAELAVGLIIAGQRGLAAAAREQVAGQWNSVRNPSVADSKVLVVGVGGVGMAICQRLVGFEVEITRVASRARQDEHSDRFGPVHGIEELPELLPEHDIVVLAVPLSEATRGLFDAELLGRLRDDALLVSVARGPVVDTDALTAELQAGRLRAALDVIDPEPLPADHPIRQCPGLTLTPHFGGNTTAFGPRAVALLRAQVLRLVAGEPLANVVYTG